MAAGEAVDGLASAAAQENLARLTEVRHAALQKQAAARKRQRELTEQMKEQLLPALQLWGLDSERQWHLRYIAAVMGEANNGPGITGADGRSRAGLF